MDLVCEQAEKDPEFRDSLQKLLGSKVKTTKAKQRKPRYDLFGRYGALDSDLEALRQELAAKPHNELVAIASAQKLGTKKTLEQMESSALVEELAQYVQGEIASWE
jgi:hypothetical protein